MSELPRYEVLEKVFIQPYIFHPGSEISTSVPPSKALHPLNDAAREAMEAYYNKEYKTRDEYGKEVTLKPNAGFRPNTEESIQADQHEVRLHALPGADAVSKADLEVLQRPLQPDLIPDGDKSVEVLDPDAPVIHKSAPAPKLKA